MKVPLNWLQDFVNLDAISQNDFCTAFTQNIAEIVGISKIHTKLEHILCVQIVDIAIHPQNSQNFICTVDTGKLQYEITTDLTGLTKNMLVPFAPIGTPFFSSIPIQTKNPGILLSEADLNLGLSNKTLMVLEQNLANIGENLSSILGITEETIIEIDNNSISNRPDLWGIYGLARECATLFNTPFQSFEKEEWKNKIESYFSIEQNPLKIDINCNKCLAYTIFYVNNIDTDIQTPWKMRQRLIACDMKPINTMVDLSNYVMLEMGIPNHFFDRNMIKSGKIRVTQSINPCKKVFTLDNQERLLSNDDILILDDTEPLAIAGIIGLKHSSVSKVSKEIVIEGGIWNSQSIRQSSSRLGLRTEASLRYEKSLDPHMLTLMLLRCAQLIHTLYPHASISGPLQIAVPLTSLPKEIITLDLNYAQKLLSMEFSTKQAQNILQKLGFMVEVNSNHILKVSPPSWRLTRGKLLDADLIEEIGRIIGYNHIKPSIPYFSGHPQKLPYYVQLKRKIQDFLVYKGQALEILSNPLIGKKLLNLAEWPIKNDNLVLLHAISPDHDRFRPSLVPSLIEALLLNQKYFDRFRFFEIGRIAQSLDKEVQHIGYIHVQKQKSTFMEIVDLVDQLLNCLGITIDFIPEPTQNNPLLPNSWEGTHPNEILHLQWNEKIIGYITTLNPFFCQKKKIQGYVTLFEINFSACLNQSKHISAINYQSLIKYPGTVLDISVFAQATIPVITIIECIDHAQNKPNYITDIKIVDIFQQDDIFNTVTLRIFLNCRDHTLSHEEIQESLNMLIQILKLNGFPLKN